MPSAMPAWLILLVVHSCLPGTWGFGSYREKIPNGYDVKYQGMGVSAVGHVRYVSD